MKVALLYGKNVFETGVRRYADMLEQGLRAYGDDAQRVEVERREWRIGQRRVGGFLSYWASRAGARPKGFDVAHALDPTTALRGTDVVTVHDLVTEEFPDLYQRDLATKLDARFTRVMAKRAPQLICDSEATREVVLARWRVDAARTTVIAPGIDHARFRPIERASAHLATGRPNLVFIGANNPRKNLLLAVETCAAFTRATGIRPRFLRLGPNKFPDLQLAYTERANALDVDLVEPGFLDDEEVVAILSHAQAFLWPPVAEGFGFPPLEAMACGLPVLALDTPINREIGGDAAHYHKADAEDAARALAALLRAPPSRERLLAHARTYTWERTVRETRAVYERLV